MISQSTLYTQFRTRAFKIMLVTATFLASVVPAPAQDRMFQFGLMGDTGYTAKGIEEFKRLLTQLNRTELAFVVHIGDFQADGRGYTRNPTAGPMPCTNESYQMIYDAFQSLRHPLIFTPGDNEWTDCSKVEGRNFDPLQLLAKVRGMFFPEGKSLGQRPISVESQSSEPQYQKFKENLRWSPGGVTFATLHIVGSNAASKATWYTPRLL